MRQNHHSSVEFAIRFGVEKVEAIAAEYSYADDEDVIAIGEDVRRHGVLTCEQFLELGRWKSPRIEHHLKTNDPVLVEEVTRFALSAQSEKARIESLMILRGVAGPMASVILHFCHTDPYPILDFRAVWSVGAEVPWVWSFPFWSVYTEFCRGLAHEAGVSMRTLDQALWQYSKDHQPVR